MLTEPEITALIEAVRQVAKAEILPRFRNLEASEVDAKSAPDDLVTIADQAAERALTALSKQILPGTEVVGEEAVAEDPSLIDRIGLADRVVILDPIDGTLNFVDGIGTFGVILAVVEAGETVFGLLYDPLGDDWVAAAKGQGAWFASARGTRRMLTCRKMAEPQGATGLIGLRLFEAKNRPDLLRAYAEFGAMRSLGCSCHDYRMLALGRADFSVSPMMNPWDHAAGVLVVQEAGGLVLAGPNAAPYRPADTVGPVLAIGDPALAQHVQAAQAAEPKSRPA